MEKEKFVKLIYEVEYEEDGRLIKKNVPLYGKLLEKTEGFVKVGFLEGGGSARTIARKLILEMTETNWEERRW